MLTGRNIIVVGASAGGVEALRRLASALPADFPGTIFVVLHAWAGGKSLMPEILSRAGPLPARHPENGDPIVPGAIYLAPPDEHMMLERERILIVRGPRENRSRPAINVLFRSAAEAFGPRAVGVVLTGALDDGVAGLWAVKRCGGIAVVQDPAEALFPDMPRAALEEVAVDHALPLAEIAPLLVRLAHEAPPPAAAPIATEIQTGNQGARMNSSDVSLDQMGKRSVFSCPECGGALWEIDAGGSPLYRCHVGHALSAGVLAAEQAGVIEQSLWSAIRALKESAALDERVATRSASHGLDKAAAAHRRNAEEKMTQVANLTSFVAGLPAAVPPPS